MVIMYADRITDSIKNAMTETERRRKKADPIQQKEPDNPQISYQTHS